MKPTKQTIIALVALLALGLGICVALFCETGWVKIIGLVVAMISVFVAIDYMAEGI